MNTLMGVTATLFVWIMQQPAQATKPFRLVIPDQSATECIRLAAMPVGRTDTAAIAKRYPMQVFRIDSSIAARMPMPVDRRPPCYQLDSTARK